MSDEETTTRQAKNLGQGDVPGWQERRWRIERLYMATTMQVHPHGSKAWLARLLGLRPKTVSRYTRPSEREDARTPERETWARIEALEDRAGAQALQEAESRLKRYYEQEPDGTLDWEQF